MSLLSMLDSFANGTLVEDMLDSVVKGVDQLEQLVGTGEEKLESALNTVENASQKVIDTTDKASNVIDVVNNKLGK